MTEFNPSISFQSPLPSLPPNTSTPVAPAPTRRLTMPDSSRSARSGSRRMSLHWVCIRQCCKGWTGSHLTRLMSISVNRGNGTPQTYAFASTATAPSISARKWLGNERLHAETIYDKPKIQLNIRGNFWNRYQSCRLKRSTEKFCTTPECDEI
jgi:hypothetical protein